VLRAGGHFVRGRELDGGELGCARLVRGVACVVGALRCRRGLLGDCDSQSCECVSVGGGGGLGGVVQGASVGELSVVSPDREEELMATVHRGLSAVPSGMDVCVVVPECGVLLDGSASERGQARSLAALPGEVLPGGVVRSVCVRLRSEAIPALDERARASLEGEDGVGGGEAVLWALANLNVALSQLPSGASARVSGMVRVVDQRREAPAPAVAVAFSAHESGVRFGTDSSGL
jgi:hypothetical protein